MKRHLDLLGVKEWNDDLSKMLKTQGIDKMLTLLNDNPKWLDALAEEIKGVIG